MSLILSRRSMSIALRALLLTVVAGALFLAAQQRQQRHRDVRHATARDAAIDTASRDALGPASLAAEASRMPRFEAYPVTEAFTGPPAPVDLNSAEGARQFRTVLGEGTAKGPNFSGHYTVVSWGCGTACQSFAIVDARSGRVTFGPHPTSVGLSYRLDSSLLITDPIDPWRAAYGPDAEDAVGAYTESHYYHWIGTRLEHVGAIELGTALRRERAVPRQVHSGTTQP